MAIITNLQPPAGASIAADAVLQFDVIDPVIEDLRIFVWVVFRETGQVELAYDADNFQALYSFAVIESIPGGRRFTIRRVGGWPSTPELRADTCACPPEVGEAADGEVNTASNRPGGVGLFKVKAGFDLQFKSLESSDGSVTISGGTETVDLTVALAGGDSDAIHDNVASEISAITAKGTPTTSDFLLIEDAAAANAKKRITIGDLPSGAAAAPLPGTWSEGILFHIDPNNANSWVPNQTTTWTDVVGGLVGTASNVTIVDGYPDFNATTSVVDFGACPSEIATAFVGKGVVSVWVSVNSDGELNTGTIIDAGNDTENWSIRTTNESAGQCKITFEHKFTTTPGIWTTTATVTKTGLWHHILITYDADSVANNPTASLNGEALPTMVEDSTPVGTADTGTAQNLTVGNDAATTQTFDGLIGPITIWGGTGPSSVEAITAQFDRRASEFSYRQPFTLSNDTLWAAQGDLVYGIGNDSSTILGIGTTGQVLTVSGGAAPSWADAPGGGTPQPGTISEGLAFHVDYNNAASWAPNQATTWTDLIGGLVGTAANIFQSKGHLGFATASNSVVNFGVVTATMADLFAGGGAVEVCLRITSDGELNEGRIIDAGDGGQNWSLYVSGESAGFVKLTFFHDFDTTGGVWSSTLKIPISEFVVLTIKYDSDSTANDPSAWMDGLTLGAMTEDTTPVGTAQTTTTGVDLAIGNDESLAHTFDGSIETVSAWNQTINDEEISDNANVRRARLGLTVTNTAGDLEYATSWSGRDRLAIGTAGQVLTVNSGATAPEWADAAGALMPQPGIILDSTEFMIDLVNSTSLAPGQTATVLDLIGGSVGTTDGLTVDDDGHLFWGGAGNDEIDFGALSASQQNVFSSGGAIDFYVRVQSDGEGNVGTIIDTTDGTSTEGYIIWTHSEVSGKYKVGFQRNFSGTNGVWSTLNAEFALDVWYHVIIEYDEDSTSNDAAFRVNNRSVPESRTATPVGTAGSDSGNTLYVGNNAGNTAAFHGNIGYLCLRQPSTGTVTDAENGATYSTLRPRFHEDGATATGTGSTAAGSTNTRIRRFVTRTTEGAGLTWSDVIAIGSYLTVANDCLVSITFTFTDGAPTSPGAIAVNFADALSNTWDTTARRAPQPVGAATNDSVTSTWIGKVKAGQLIWCSTAIASANGGTSTSDYRVDVAVIMEF